MAEMALIFQNGTLRGLSGGYEDLLARENNPTFENNGVTIEVTARDEVESMIDAQRTAKNLDNQQKPLFTGKPQGGTSKNVTVTGSGVPGSRTVSSGPTGGDASAPGTTPAAPGPTDRTDKTMLIAVGAVVVASGLLWWMGETA